MFYLYKHTFPNGKVYIGITKRQPEDRWGIDGSGYLKLNKFGKPAQARMYYAIKKYGWENVQHEILLETNDEKEIEREERKYIGKISEHQKELFKNKYKGSGNPCYGKKWWNNGEVNKLSKECPGDGFVLGVLPLSEERLAIVKRNQKISLEKRKGLCWWNNGKINKMFKENPGDGWTKGMLPMPREAVIKNALNHKGKKFWNNGKIQVLSKECPGEDFKLGMLPISEEKRKTRKQQAQKLLKKEGYREELIKRIYQSALGKHWWNDGVNEVLSDKCPSENFKKGRLPISDEKRKNMGKHVIGKKWWNNGKTQVLDSKCPDGFVAGMLKNKVN